MKKFLGTMLICGLLTVSFTSCDEEQCTNTCSFASDGECDDGGSGSITSLCDLGTDCNDCGAR